MALVRNNIPDSLFNGKQLKDKSVVLLIAAGQAFSFHVLRSMNQFVIRVILVIRSRGIVKLLSLIRLMTD